MNFVRVWVREWARVHARDHKVVSKENFGNEYLACECECAARLYIKFIITSKKRRIKYEREHEMCVACLFNVTSMMYDQLIYDVVVKTPKKSFNKRPQSTAAQLYSKNLVNTFHFLYSNFIAEHFGCCFQFKLLFIKRCIPFWLCDIHCVALRQPQFYSHFFPALLDGSLFLFWVLVVVVVFIHVETLTFHHFPYVRACV